MTSLVDARQERLSSNGFIGCPPAPHRGVLYPSYAPHEPSQGPPSSRKVIWPEGTSPFAIAHSHGRLVGSLLRVCTLHAHSPLGAELARVPA